MASGGLSVKELNDLLDRLASSENRCFCLVSYSCFWSERI